LLGGAAAAWPLAARAQQPENPVRIGFLPNGSPSNFSLVEAFRQGLREVGAVENRHVVLDVVVWHAVDSEGEVPGWVGHESLSLEFGAGRPAHRHDHSRTK
jgi:hypothetical protein